VGAAAGASEARPPVPPFDIDAYEVKGATLLTAGEIETAVYPFLGPGRSEADVEQARGAIEALYQQKGYQTVLVTVPTQDPGAGVIRIDVNEVKVGRLRVRGSRYHSLEQIKAEAPSLAEGRVPNFNQAEKDLATLNQLPDRRVTPVLRAGATPGTVDVDLVVEDSLPLHASVEVNNRKSQDTEPLRVVSDIRYDNLWQLGHSVSFSYQVAPQRPSDAQVWAGSYLARVPAVPELSFLVFGYRSKSDVATLGATDVIGDGRAVGGRVIWSLPGAADFFHSVSGGVDWKDFDEVIAVGSGETEAPITYYPFTVAYSAVARGETSVTQAGANVVFNFRGLGSDEETFDNKRFEASDSFIYLRTNASRSEDLPHDLVLFGRFEGQVASGALVNNEQIAAGGQDTVRGFLEALALGDYGFVGAVELRSPSLAPWVGKLGGGQAVDEWRFHVFVDGAVLGLFDALPEQENRFDLASIGIGTRIKLFKALTGAVEFALPLVSGGVSLDDTQWVQFRVVGEL
jgi:hemolysin activation/secretion protein